MEHNWENDLVSVIIPLYNAEHYIGETIDSVLAQSYQKYEIVVVDDRSTDGSAAIVLDYCTREPRIRYFLQEKNMGAAEARNRALREARGRYVAFLDSDDLWTHDKLEKQLALLSQPDVAFVFCAYDMIDADSQPIKGKIRIKPRLRYRDLLTKTMIATPTVVLDRGKLGSRQMPLRRTGQDYAFWLSLLHDTDACGIDEALVHVRRRGDSLSKSKLQNVRDVWEVQTRNERLPAVKAALNLAAYCLYTVKKRYF